jgi:hypothetical protein
MALTASIYRKVFQVIATLVLLGLPAWADWPPIPPEDLKMTDLPEQKGAPAVILLREEVADDLNNYHSVYERIKILTETGRRYADVELPYWRRAFTIDGVSGRTIHADGSAIPFDGHIFDKMALRARRGHIDEVRVHVKAFTLPDVQVGSIIEFRYSLRYADNTFLAPEWLVQEDLFQRRATFKYIPYDGPVIMRHGRIGQGAAWTAFLPTQGPQPQLHKVLLSSQASRHQAGQYIDLSIENMPPIAEEPHMPPVGMLRYRVQFYYRDQFNPSPEAFWKEEGKFWSKDVEKFLDDKSGIDDAMAKTALPTDSPEQKVRNIYAFVTRLENQSFRAQRTEQEEKGIGLKANRGAGDVLRQRSGTHDDLNRLFAAMVRTAGISASMMWVASREETLFQPQLMSTYQLKGEIAIVQLGGKDVFLDPGTKYCPYGLLDWQYAGSQGLRQSANKGTTEFAASPLSDYGQAEIMRLARLQLGEDGKAEGTIKIGFYGLEAMDRRQKASLTDEAGRKRLLEDEVRKWLPDNSEVTLTGAQNWDETEPHLATEFKISVPLAANAGKRWLIPVHIFQVNAKPVFSGSERVNSIYLWYKARELDEVHLALPPSLEVESLPPNDSVKFDYALYSVSQKPEPANSIVARRDFVMGGYAFPASVYGELKGFYDKVKAGDDQQMILRGSARAEAK